MKAGLLKKVYTIMTFRPRYALSALALFLVEVAIALYVHDAFIRPYGGDVLATILVYLGLRAVTPMKVWPAALTALAISFTVELAQALDAIHWLGLTGNPLAETVLGTRFAWGDMLAYGFGFVIILGAEFCRPSSSPA